MGQPGPVLQQGAYMPCIQGEFASIRDSVTNVKLPADVRLSDASKQCVRRYDHPHANAMIKCYVNILYMCSGIRGWGIDKIR